MVIDGILPIACDSPGNLHLRVKHSLRKRPSHDVIYANDTSASQTPFICDRLMLRGNFYNTSSRVERTINCQGEGSHHFQGAEVGLPSPKGPAKMLDHLNAILGVSLKLLPVAILENDFHAVEIRIGYLSSLGFNHSFGS